MVSLPLRFLYVFFAILNRFPLASSTSLALELESLAWARNEIGEVSRQWPTRPHKNQVSIHILFTLPVCQIGMLQSHDTVSPFKYVLRCPREVSRFPVHLCHEVQSSNHRIWYCLFRRHLLLSLSVGCKHEHVANRICMRLLLVSKKSTGMPVLHDKHNQSTTTSNAMRALLT